MGLSSAKTNAEDKPIRLIDGSELLRLLAEHLDINAIVDSDSGQTNIG